MYKVGLDIGSTTIKIVVIDDDGTVVFSRYERHQAKIRSLLEKYIAALREQIGDVPITLNVTGSIGMGIAEKCSLYFVQEVVASTNYIRKIYPHISTFIDIGGEDAKVALFHENEATDLRMNGNCAGGTGAFIDQMAILLDVSIDELNDLALQATQIYPLASRCGVFCKTDIQNLIAKNVSKENIAASIFHAVAVQTVTTLAHGCSILAPILFCGGPLTFIPALRKAFVDYLHLSGNDIILPEKSNLIPAWGAALANNTDTIKISSLLELLANSLNTFSISHNFLSPFFADAKEYKQWKEQKYWYQVQCAELSSGVHDVTIGIDSGSTTTKIVVLDNQSKMLYSYYSANEGNPINAVRKGLQQLDSDCQKRGAILKIRGGCSTGYGEDLIKAAFQLDIGIVETIAHYLAAKHINEKVSFILDIGGQDMKAMFVNGGVINRIEINEACSSGCGSFMETFARSLNYNIQDFAKLACFAESPCDLGTRCTVFMNSKVKQVLREGASIADISAGLSYSVVKNCLYKVLQLRNIEELGTNIIVQGGTMRNDSIVRALEILIGKSVFRSDCPELMGAYGCALYAQQLEHIKEITLDEMLSSAQYMSRQQQCHGCENTCIVTRYQFNNNRYFSGNRCEKVFSNQGNAIKKGMNAYAEKNKLLFDRNDEVCDSLLTIGIPRCLNMYEEYPFWYTLFTYSGIRVYLSESSTFENYESGVKMVMADNICFPAKLVHSHIQNLVSRQVDRIFMPFVVYEKPEDHQQNSYNCPIVSGYSEVIKSVQSGTIPIDSPSITFKEQKLLYKQCKTYLISLGVPEQRIKSAFSKALEDQSLFETEMSVYNRTIVENARQEHKMILLLAGRPYHTDPLIQHGLSDMIAALGVNVITDDIVRQQNISLDDVHFVSQWAYPDRILKAAKWVATQDADIQYVQMTSFGCGPDAFLLDEIRSLLKRYGKTLTILKIDDVSNTGSLKLRVRSLVESLNFSLKQTSSAARQEFVSTPTYQRNDRKRKIIVPFFTPFISPLIPSLMKKAGYDVENLPMSDTASSDWGLRFANNEVCYPATLIVGDLIKALKSGKYDPANIAIAITQTGGQCRASNYISLIKKALVESGYADVPVVSLSMGSGLRNKQPGFKIHWLKMLPITLASILYSDCIAEFYYASVIRENKEGEAARLRNMYLKMAETVISQNKPYDFIDYLSLAAKDFNAICNQGQYSKVGMVGEIFLKFNPFAQKNITDWLINQGIEVMPPLLTNFFIQSFVNAEYNQDVHLQKRVIPEFTIHWLYKRVQNLIDRFNDAAKEFHYFTPFKNIYDEAKDAEKVISLSAQFGEGWLLPGEILSYAKQKINHVISVQPFGCIANHIVAKGIEKRIKSLYPQMNILYLDFDSSVSDVNIVNRLLLFIDELKKEKEYGSN
ncbi:MAG: acyl-CoA dehydratase activase [Bacteroides sp.]|jgi:predicted CoA-substrate-specific enzyme activase|nr:acyl-CoA dehydratase activase [Bacteroides sp.]